MSSETRVHYRTCPLCEAMCGLEVHVEDDRVAAIRPDRDDVWSKGYICPKGTTLGAPAPRPRPPARADGPRRRHVARGRLGRGVRALRGAARTACSSGTAIEAVTAYIGNPTAHNFSLGRYVGALHRHRRSSRRSTRPAPSTSGRRTSLQLMYGEHVEDPDARHPAHRLLGHAWAATRRRRRAACSRAPTSLGEIDAHPRARRQGRRHRPAPHRHRRARRRVDADRARHRRRVPARDRATCCSPTASCDLGDARRAASTASTTCARSRADFTPERVDATPAASPPTTIRRLAHELAAAPTRGASTAASGSATRSSARSRRGSSTS